MNKSSGYIKTFLSIFFDILISVYIATQFIYYLCAYFIDRYYPITVDTIGVRYFFLVMSLIAIFSITMLEIKFNNELRKAYHERNTSFSVKNDLLFAIKETPLFAVLLIFVLLYLILPLNLTYAVLADVFTSKLLALAIYLPLFIIIYTSAVLSAEKFWSKNKTQEKYKNEIAYRESITFGISYGVSTIGVVFLYPYLQKLPSFLSKLLTLKTLIAVLVLILVIVGLRFLRAYLKRKDCIKKLKELCKAKGYDLSELRFPYRSLITDCDGESFSVTVNEKTYSCKLMGSNQKHSPLIIYPNGTLETVVSRNKLFQHSSLAAFGYESNNKQILIINPTPKFLYTFRDGKVVPIDNGEIIGNYKVYTSSAFLRALELDVLDK